MRHAVLLWAVLAVLAQPLPALARDTAPDGLPPSAQQPDDRELGDFVAAFVRLMGVQHGYMMLMRGEGDPDRLIQMRRNAAADMKSAVERDGLTIDRYNQIALAVRSDPGLQGRIEGILQQLAADPGAED